MIKRFASLLTAEVNAKGVLDVDTVKGCAGGIAANGEHGCYGACYAEAIARFRGFDFAKPITRKVTTHAQAKKIEDSVKAAPQHFFRIGVMGDPSHDWAETVEVIGWLAQFARAIVVTKHWMRASDEQMRRMAGAGAILNTSVSAMDTSAQLSHREAQMSRFAAFGGHSVARVVSCEWNTDTAEGKDRQATQARLLGTPGAIDNPLRIAATHPMARDGLVRLTKTKDLNTTRTISIASEAAYVGHCASCPDQCGMASMPRTYGQSADLFNGM